MPTARSLQEEVGEYGFAICEDILTPTEIARLIAAIERIDRLESVRKRAGVFAVRNLLDESAEVRELANSQRVCALVEPILGPRFLPVRGILFDKIPDANWRVPWHQDLTIAIQEKVEADGFGPWSIKAGVLHVQPPATVMEKMISVRLHLDCCSQSNGALRVIPASHLQGRIPEEKIAAIREGASERVCEVGVGGALLMRPLLLHASSPSLIPGHRRVIHFDFAAAPLPNGMRWLSDRLAT